MTDSSRYSTAIYSTILKGVRCTCGYDKYGFTSAPGVLRAARRHAATHPEEASSE